MQTPASPPKYTQAAVVWGGGGVTLGFPRCPPHRVPYLAMAMALKLVCPSEMAFRMAVRSAHTPRL